jgi:multisubunit Na+/H+ antiporter MnhF subunit
MKFTIQLLVALISNADARHIMYEASVLLPILSFLSSNDIEIRALWYEGLKELCAY